MMSEARSGAPSRLNQRHVEIALVVTAALTALAGALLGEAGGSTAAAAAYLAGTMLALLNPSAIFVQVVAGQVLVGTLLMRQEGPGPLPLVLLVCAVVVTAELLALVARMRAVRRPGQDGELVRVGVAAATAGLVFFAVLWVGALPGPTGLAAVFVTSAACALLAYLMVRPAA